MKFDNKRSLERALLRDFPGSKSLVDAFKMAKTQKQDLPSVKTTSNYQSVCAALQKVEDLTKSFDIDKLPPETRFSLGQMPLDTMEEINAWVTAWVNVIGSREDDKTSGGDSDPWST